MPSVSVENYLKAVYHLGTSGERVKTKALADHLDVSLPSVTSMVQTMATDDLVEYIPYRGVRLSKKGRISALKVIRKHRLVEMFLVETLGFTWDEVHAEAELLEHAITDLLAERIDKYLGFPRFDPHGDPIPTADGEIYHPESVALDGAAPGFHGKVVRVLDQNPEVLRHLTRLGLVPDADFRVLEVLDFDGQMKLEIAEAECSVSRKLAARLLVMERE